MRRSNQAHGQSHRRGVTLVEMLVVVALLVLMMTILASIFQVATGAISTSRTIQELDNNLKFLDMTIRRDLEGVTAKMTPPNDPAQKRGFFEYGENAPADLQGEDTDDYLAFTAKAPEGQPFRGRVWIYTTGVNPKFDPVTVTSEFAEVIYFLRNGNLYRRVLLVAPTRNGSLTRQFNPTSPILATSGTYTPNMFNNQTVGWLAVNDISAHPAIGPSTIQGNSNNIPVANDLGDLTNRENRFARQRFCNDYWNVLTVNSGRDGIIDDGNLDGIPDYWPTLTASQVALAMSAGDRTNSNNWPVPAYQLMNEDAASMPGGTNTKGTPGAFGRFATSPSAFCFPFIFPGMYTVPENNSLANGSSLGWLHSLDSRSVAGVEPNGGLLNHAPLEFGDSLPIPDPTVPNKPGFQSWFGFPTWRETASPYWRDPVDTIAEGSTLITMNIPPGVQMPGLQPWNQSLTPVANGNPANLLPALGVVATAHGVPYESDGVGNPNAAGVATATPFTGPLNAWEDDLIMTGVRSFDVKAYDPNPSIYNNPQLNIFYSAGYYDLGYASTDYIRASGGSNTALTAGTPLAIQDSNGNPQGFGHEGRMPPLISDFRFDPQRPFIKDGNNLPFPNNVGDNTVGALAPQRLRRVWESWSTDYTNAPSVDVNLRGSPLQSYPLDRPIYPSYPAPYPQPLRGIQIQIRVVDPKNERVKVLTIRQDFSDKLQ